MTIEGAGESFGESTDDDLAQRFLASEADFWRHVQEPTKRVSDPVLLTRLAGIAYRTFATNHVRAACAVVIAYKSVDGMEVPGWSGAQTMEALAKARSALDIRSGFVDFRWYLSSILAESAMCLRCSDFGRLTSVVKLDADLCDDAVLHGQLFTNIVKITFLRSAVGFLTRYRFDDVDHVARAVSRALNRAPFAPSRYRFDNQYAYEELAYVFTLLRQLRIWKDCYGEPGGGQAMADRLANCGWNWKAIGTPFQSLMPKDFKP